MRQVSPLLMGHLVHLFTEMDDSTREAYLELGEALILAQNAKARLNLLDELVTSGGIVAYGPKETTP